MAFSSSSSTWNRHTDLTSGFKHVHSSSCPSQKVAGKSWKIPVDSHKKTSILQFLHHLCWWTPAKSLTFLGVFCPADLGLRNHFTLQMLLGSSLWRAGVLAEKSRRVKEPQPTQTLSFLHSFCRLCLVLIVVFGPSHWGIEMHKLFLSKFQIQRHL